MLKSKREYREQKKKKKQKKIKIKTGLTWPFTVQAESANLTVKLNLLLDVSILDITHYLSSENAIAPSFIGNQIVTLKASLHRSSSSSMEASVAPILLSQRRVPRSKQALRGCGRPARQARRRPANYKCLAECRKGGDRAASSELEMFSGPMRYRRNNTGRIKTLGQSGA